MKKGVAIGIGLSIIVVAIIVGIASLPDEVLIENPSLETSENLPQSEEQIEVPTVEPVVEESAETSVQPPAEEPIVEESAETPVQPPAEEPVVEEPAEESDDNVIKVEIRDGIGSGDK